jgi:NAD(P)H-nitrite reductase large subunit
MVGVKEDEIDQIWSELGTEKGAAIGLCIRSVKACPGTTFCKKGMQDSLGMGLYLDEKYHGLEVPGKLKLAVSGCVHQCSENCIKDISLLGKKNGWDLMVGGNGGAKPRLAFTILKNLNDEEAKYYVDRVIKFMKEYSKKNERLSKVIDRETIDLFMEFVLEFREVDDDKIVVDWKKSSEGVA